MIKNLQRLLFIAIPFTCAQLCSANPFKFVFVNISDAALYVAVEPNENISPLKTMLVPADSYIPLDVKNNVTVSVFKSTSSLEKASNCYPLTPTSGNQPTYGVALCTGNIDDHYWFGFDSKFELSDDNINDYLSKSGFTQKFNRIELQLD